MLLIYIPNLYFFVSNEASGLNHRKQAGTENGIYSSNKGLSADDDAMLYSLLSSAS